MKCLLSDQIKSAPLFRSEGHRRYARCSTLSSHNVHQDSLDNIQPAQKGTASCKTQTRDRDDITAFITPLPLGVVKNFPTISLTNLKSRRGKPHGVANHS